MQSAAAMPTATAGDESNIVKENVGRIRYMAVPFIGRGISLDDLVQEGSMALLEAARKWDPTLGVKLWTYARKFVLGAIFRFIATEINEPCRVLAAEAGGESDEEEADLIGRIADGDPSPEEIAALGEDLAHLEQEIDALSEDERIILWKCFGEDKTLRDVSRELSSPHHCTVQRVYHGAIEKLRNRMEARA